MRSKYISAEKFVDFCAEVFHFSSKIEDPAKSTNDWLGGLDLSTDKIIFINAGEDPWKWAGQTNSTLAESRGQKAYVMDCDDCGHCKDLHGTDPSDPKEVTYARQLVKDTLRDWLGI